MLDRAAGELYPYSGWTAHQEQLLPSSDTFVYAWEPYTLEFLDAPHLKAYGRDSATTYNEDQAAYLTWDAGSWKSYIAVWLAYSPDTSDARYVIDGVMGNLDADRQGVGTEYASCAGVFNPIEQHVMVRKATVTKPQADWYKSAGIDAVDSEWLLLPVNNTAIGGGDNLVGSVARPGDRIPFTTAGIHGD